MRYCSLFQAKIMIVKKNKIGFTKSLCKEVGRRNIRVNCIAPGFTTTDMTVGMYDVVN